MANGFTPHAFVYCFCEEPNDGYYKFGITDGHPADRIRQLQTGNPRQLREVAVFPFGRDHVAQVEKWMHTNLEQYRAVGEWFRLTPEQRDSALNRLLELMQAAWKEYTINPDMKVYATWGDNYRFGVLPVPAWLLERRSGYRATARPLALPEWE